MIDTHVHLWDEPLDWMTDEMAVLRRPFGLDELRPSLTAHGVEVVVLVQTHSSLEETRRFLALADADDLVTGVVGWVDLTAPGVAAVIEELGESPHLVGIRHQVHDEPDPAWLLRDDVLRGLAAVRNAGLAYDLLVRPRELPAALEVARRLPELRLVIDHAAKPPVATGELEPWRARMAPFAELEHVSCKVSGLVTEADWKRGNAGRSRPVRLAPPEWFGPETAAVRLGLAGVPARGVLRRGRRRVRACAGRPRPAGPHSRKGLPAALCALVTNSYLKGERLPSSLRDHKARQRTPAPAEAKTVSARPSRPVRERYVSTISPPRRSASSTSVSTSTAPPKPAPSRREP